MHEGGSLLPNVWGVALAALAALEVAFAFHGGRCQVLRRGC